jgi:hypothetical protein
MKLNKAITTMAVLSAAVLGLGCRSACGGDRTCDGRDIWRVPPTLTERKLAELPDEPDEAMLLRDWPVTPAYFSSGTIPVGVTGRAVEMNEGLCSPMYLLDLPTHLFNLVMFPAAFFFNNPAAPVLTRPSVYAPSYHAMPPLPSPPVSDPVSPAPGAEPVAVEEMEPSTTQAPESDSPEPAEESAGPVIIVPSTQPLQPPE